MAESIDFPPVPILVAVHAHMDYIRAGHAKQDAVRLLDGGELKGPENDQFRQCIKALREAGVDV